jgi:hypothetical protein
MISQLTTTPLKNKDSAIQISFKIYRANIYLKFDFIGPPWPPFSDELKLDVKK